MPEPITMAAIAGLGAAGQLGGTAMSIFGNKPKDRDEQVRRYLMATMPRQSVGGTMPAGVAPSVYAGAPGAFSRPYGGAPPMRDQVALELFKQLPGMLGGQLGGGGAAGAAKQGQGAAILSALMGMGGGG